MHKSTNTPQNKGDKAISRVTTLPAILNRERMANNKNKQYLYNITHI